jgi:hypothetical protein
MMFFNDVVLPIFSRRHNIAAPFARQFWTCSMYSFDVSSPETPASVSTATERTRIGRKLGVVTGHRCMIHK